MEIISRYSTAGQCFILLSVVLWLILKPAEDNRSKKAGTASYDMMQSSSFIFRIKILGIEEERSETLTKNMKLLIFLTVTLGLLVTGLESVSFEINAGGWRGCPLGTTSGFNFTSALDGVAGFWLEFWVLLPSLVHMHLLYIYLQETCFWTP